MGILTSKMFCQISPGMFASPPAASHWQVQYYTWNRLILALHALSNIYCSIKNRNHYNISTNDTSVVWSYKSVNLCSPQKYVQTWNPLHLQLVIHVFITTFRLLVLIIRTGARCLQQKSWQKYDKSVPNVFRPLPRCSLFRG